MKLEDIQDPATREALRRKMDSETAGKMAGAFKPLADGVAGQKQWIVYDHGVAVDVEEAEKPKRKRGPKKLNKTEQRAYDRAKEVWPGWLIIPHGLTFTFDDGDRYTPDFFMVPLIAERRDNLPCIVEVKGGYRGPGWEQGYERFKRAREKWARWFGFEMWTWKGGRWEAT